MGSAASYGTVTFTKKFYIFGPGYFLSENPNTQANAASAFTDGVVTFNTGSAGSVVTGMTFTNYMYIYVNNIVLRRNAFVGPATTFFIDVNTGVTNLIFVGNYINYQQSSATYKALWIEASNSNCVIANNFITTTGATSYAIYVDPLSTVQISNNVINGKVEMTGGNFDNNILVNGTFTGTGLTWFNNLGNSTQFGTANGNQQTVNMAAGACFVSSGTTDGKWQLAPASPAKAAGLAGIDCGMFGGTSPYVLSGIPSIPTIYYFSSPVSGSSSQGLPVTIKAKSRN